MAVVLNIEADHLDCYADMDDLRQAFLDYINRVPFYGSAILSADDANIAQIRDRITRPFATFGFGVDADYRAVDIRADGDRMLFTVIRKDEIAGNIVLRVPGKHNVANALAAIAAATELDIPFETIADALAQFTGVGRRFEVVGEVNDILLVDDYAHHPTEIAAALATAKDVYNRRVIAVFQPHLYSRTQVFAREFADVLSAADWCVLTAIYPAREEPIEGVTSELIQKLAAEKGHTNFSYVGRKMHAAAEIEKRVQRGDMVMLIGAGSITHIRAEVLEMLERK